MDFLLEDKCVIHISLPKCGGGGSTKSFLLFSFQDQFCEQVKGAAMGSPVSPIVANLYMEYFE